MYVRDVDGRGGGNGGGRGQKKMGGVEVERAGVESREGREDEENK